MKSIQVRHVLLQIWNVLFLSLRIFLHSCIRKSFLQILEDNKWTHARIMIHTCSMLSEMMTMIEQKDYEMFSLLRNALFKCLPCSLFCPLQHESNSKKLSCLLLKSHLSMHLPTHNNDKHDSFRLIYKSFVG